MQFDWNCWEFQIIQTYYKTLMTYSTEWLETYFIAEIFKFDIKSWTKTSNHLKIYIPLVYRTFIRDDIQTQSKLLFEMNSYNQTHLQNCVSLDLFELHEIWDRENSTVSRCLNWDINRSRITCVFLLFQGKNHSNMSTGMRFGEN